MVRYLGTSTHTLDDKSRLIVPKRFTDEIAPKDAIFTVTASLDGCLLLMDKASWTEAVERLDAGAFVDSGTRAVRRVMLGHAEELQPDKTNRILINEALRTYAGLAPSADVVVVGTGKSIELWNPQLWSSALTEARKLHTFFDRVGPSAGSPAAN
jgi:MraZ protein